MHRQNVRCCPNGEPAARVPRLWPGHTIVCVAGGPSLTPDDVAYCRNRAPVLVINDAYRLAPWADVLYAADASWWRKHRGAPSFTGLKYSVQLDAADFPGVQILANTGDQGLEVQPWGLRTGRNSGYQAMNLAVHLGAARIVLLGYDMGHDAGEPSHWFGEHPAPLNRHSPYSTFRAAFETLVAPLQQCGVTVLNATRRTFLTCFPCGSLEEAMR